MSLDIRHLGGAMTRVAPESTSFSQRYAPFLMQTVTPLMSPELVEAVRHNTRLIREALRLHATGGVFPSWLGDGYHGLEYMRAGFAAEHYERLAELQRRYDPDNMFRLNHNIPPRAA